MQPMMRWLAVIEIVALAPSAALLAADDDTAKLLERGKVRLERGDYEGARLAYTRAIRLDPKRAEAYLGRARARSDAPAGALEDVTKAIELDPKLGEAYALRGDIRQYHILERDTALVDMVKAIELNFEPSERLFFHSALLRMKGELQQALTESDKTIETKNEAYRRYWRALIKERLEDFDGALSDFDYHIKFHDKPEANSFIHRAYCFWRLGKGQDGDRAAADYQKRQASNAGAAKTVADFRDLARIQSAEPQPEKPADYIKRSKQLYDLEYYEWALDDAARALAIDPKFAPAWEQRGSCLYKLRFYPSAVAAFEQAIKLKPNDEGLVDWRASVYLSMDKVDEAIADEKRALEIDDRYADAWLGLAQAYIKKERWPDALAASAKLVECAPKRVSTWRHRLIALQNAGKLDQAAAAGDQWIALKPDVIDAYLMRGALHASLGRTAQSEADYAKALELEPTSNWSYCSRAKLLLEQGDLKRAMDDLNKAVELSPNACAAGYYFRAMVKEKLGDPSAAAQDRERAVAINTHIAADMDTEFAFLKFARQTKKGVEPAPPPPSDASQPRPPMTGETAPAVEGGPRPVKIPPAVAKLVKDAKAAAKKEEWDSAIDLYSRAITLAPRYADAFLYRGLARLHQKQTAEAEMDFAQAIRLNPNLKSTLDAERAKASKTNEKP